MRTVKVKRGGPRGWHLINEADFREGEHVLFEEAKAPKEVTRTDVARMKRGEAVAMLEAHGVSETAVEGKPVAEVRAILANILFVDL